MALWSATSISFSVHKILWTSCIVLSHHPGPASSRLSHLRWLPVRRQIQYKIALLTYKSHLTNQPPYLITLLHVYQLSLFSQSESFMYSFLVLALLISVDIPSVFLLLLFGMNYPQLSSSWIPDPETHHMTTATVRLVDHGLHGWVRSCGTPDSLLLTHGLSPTTSQHGGRFDPQPVMRSTDWLTIRESNTLNTFKRRLKTHLTYLITRNE